MVEKKVSTRMIFLIIAIISVFSYTIIVFADSFQLLITLNATNPESNAYFGGSVAVDGELVVIGEMGRDINGTSEEGMVYIYNVTDGTMYNITSPNPQGSAMFGERVAVDGELVVIGERWRDINGTSNEGMVYIYNVTDCSMFNITAPNPESGAFFGWSVAVDGELVVIGEDCRDVGGTSNEGMAYIYNVTDGTMYNITSPNPQPFAYFGGSVAIDGELVVIGERWRNIDGTSNEGMVYIYNVTDGTMYNITSPNPESNAYFGWSVAVDGELVVVGEHFRNINGSGYEGMAYIYNVTDGTMFNITAPNPQNGAQFGESVAIDGKLIVIGEWTRTIVGSSEEGLTYIYMQLTPPVADADGPYQGKEGAPVTLDGSGSYDLDGAIVSYEWDLDNDGSYDDASGVSPVYSWCDDYNGPIGLNVTDDDGLYNTSTTTARISNVPPSITFFNRTRFESGCDSVIVEFFAEFSDPGWCDTHIAVWDWGDGSTSPGDLVEENNAPDSTGTVTGSHTYDCNTYQSFIVTLYVYDDDGGMASYEYRFTLSPIGGELVPNNHLLTWFIALIILPASLILNRARARAFNSLEKYFEEHPELAP